MSNLKPFKINSNSLFESNKQYESAEPLLSVLIITYKHEEYIKECLEGILMQICNFKVEIVIANDCSPDNTDEIIQQTLKENQNSSWVKYLKREQNCGAMQNFIDAYHNCNGKHIALCEGDDYWTDPYKLQKQLDVLEENPQHIGCYHRVEILNETTIDIKYSDIYKEPVDNAVTADVLKNHLIPTLSLVFRNDTSFVFPKWFSESPVGDIPLELILSLKGSFKYLEDSMGIYRYTDKGVSSANDRKMNYTFYRFIKMYGSFNSYTNKKFDAIVFDLNYEIMGRLKRRGEYSLLLKSFRYINLNSFYRIKILFFLLLGKKVT